MENKNIRSNLNSKSIYLIVITLFVVLVTIYSNRLGPYISYLIGKLNYGVNIEFNGLEFQLPSDWWIIDISDEQIRLSRLIKEDGKEPLFVYLDKQKLPKDINSSFTQTKNFDDNIVARIKPLKNDILNQNDTFSFLYEVEEPLSKKGNLYFFWLAPKINTTISAVDIDSSYEKYLYELIKQIKFK